MVRVLMRVRVVRRVHRGRLLRHSGACRVSQSAQRTRRTASNGDEQRQDDDASNATGGLSERDGKGCTKAAKVRRW